MDAKLKFLLEASAEVANQKDLYSVLIKLSQVTRDLLEADRASIFLHDRNTRELWTIVAHGIPPIRIPENKGIAGTVFLSDQMLNIEDAYRDPRFDAAVDRQSGYKTKSILAYPLRNQEKKPMGVFQIINKLASETFNREDVDLLQHLSLFVSSSLENAVLMEKIQKAGEDAIHRLSNATKFKDPETQNHIIRVGLYSYELAKAAGVPQEECDLLKLAAPMHDIGKVGVPDKILQKPAKLDADEWVIMQKHTEFGYDILKDGESSLLQVAAQVALEHHEKWNGKGYPTGKKGEDISIYGRITAIADVFDALTSKRYYKDAWPMEKTLAVMSEEKGEHFDPRLMDLFIENINTMIKIKAKYKDED